MVIIILLFGHLLCFTISIILRHIIRKYIKSKPLGHQSVLDLLLLDIMYLQTFYYTNFLLVMLVGMVGHIPFIMSQIMLSLYIHIFMLKNRMVQTKSYLYLFTYFLTPTFLFKNQVLLTLVLTENIIICISFKFHSKIRIPSPIYSILCKFVRKKSRFFEIEFWVIK